MQIDGEIMQPQFHQQQSFRQSRNIGEVVQGFEWKLWYLSETIVARWNSENTRVRHDHLPEHLSAFREKISSSTRRPSERFASCAGSYQPPIRSLSRIRRRRSGACQ